MKRCCEILFYIATAMMICTGLMMHSLEGFLAMKIIHGASGILFIIFLAGHLLRNWKKIGRKEKKDHVS